MVWFKSKKTRSNDKSLSEQYVRYAVEIGYEVCPKMAQLIDMTTQGIFELPVNDNSSVEIGKCILGTSFGLFRGHTPLISPQRGEKIETYCRSYWGELYKLKPKEKEYINDIFDLYIHLLNDATENSKNPFFDVSRFLLTKLFRKEIEELCLPDGTLPRETRDLLFHESIGDFLALCVSETMMFWKDKK